MSHNSVPVSAEPRGQRKEIDGLVAVLASVMQPHSATYVSAPITSGRRFSEWLVATAGQIGRAEEPDYRERHARHVIEPNRVAARRLVEHLRRSEPIVIDPTAMPDLEGWTQDDYRSFWGKVIERYAKRVVFLEGWEFSNGCAYEFLVASRLGLPTFDEAEGRLELAGGVDLIVRAVRELKGRGRIDVQLLEWVVGESKRLVRQPHQNAIGRREGVS